MIASDIIRKFAGLVARDEEEVSLIDAALLIAQTEYPNLDVNTQLERVKSLAQQLRVDPGYSALTNIEAMNDLLFTREGFSGNDQDYDDPRNSFLNDVLDRRIGIPITLSVIYMELGRRHQLPIQGVGLPGHFIVKYSGPEEDILIDPYHQGAILNRGDCAKLLKAHFDDAELLPEYLDSSTKKQILTRMLNNLKGSFFRRKHYERVLTMIEMAMAVDPASRHHIHDRGVIYFLLRQYARAAADLNAYLTYAAPDDPGIQSARSVLHHIRSLMN
ncbi:MAG TPA: transglutaminase-like domain-containing protein [Terriglobia bacterium]|nr:transglutaminase-like domain-containing protein [Terriglobia bacterium]